MCHVDLRKFGLSYHPWLRYSQAYTNVYTEFSSPRAVLASLELQQFMVIPIPSIQITCIQCRFLEEIEACSDMVLS